MWEIRACAFFLRTARNDDEHLDIQDFSVATAIAATGCAVRVSDCMQTIAWSLQGYAPSFNAMLAVPNDDCSQSLNEIMNQMLSPEAGTADAGSTKSGNDQATSIATLNALMTGQQGDTAEIVPVPATRAASPVHRFRPPAQAWGPTQSPPPRPCPTT